MRTMRTNFQKVPLEPPAGETTFRKTVRMVRTVRTIDVFPENGACPPPPVGTALAGRGWEGTSTVDPGNARRRACGKLH
jgi:hypothetical protein